MKSEDISGKTGLFPRRRPYFYGLAMILGFLITFLAVIIPVMVIKNIDSSKMGKYIIEETAAAHRWNQIMQNLVTYTLALTFKMEGFVFSNLTSIPPLRGSIEERMEDQYYSRFDVLADVLSLPPVHITTVLLCPGGVITQTYPELKELHGVDLFELNPLAWDVFESGTNKVEGPTQSKDGTWVFNIIEPVFNSTTKEEQVEENFWGFVSFGADIRKTMDNTQISEAMQLLDMAYALYTQTESGPAVISSSFDASLTNEEFNQYLRHSTTMAFDGALSNLSVAVSKQHKQLILSSSVLTAIIAIVSTFGVICIFIAVIFIAYFTQPYCGIEHAPKSAPFAVLVIGPQQGEQLWNIAPDEMSDITEKLKVVLERNMVKFHAYQIPQLQPYTTTYVLRHIDDAVKMTFSIIEELYENPIDGPIQNFRGPNGRLFISYAAHWCKVGTVLLDPTGSKERIRYEGPDLLFGPKIWRKAVPNVMVISTAAKEEITLRNLTIHTFQPCAARVGEAGQSLYCVFDVSRPTLQKAKAETENYLTQSEGGNSLNPLSFTTIGEAMETRCKQSASPKANSFGDDAGADKTSSGFRAGVVAEGEEGKKVSGKETMEAFNRAVLEPQIPASLSSALRSAFENQGVSVGVEFDSLKIMMFYFYSCFKLMFKPLAGSQRHNIYMRLIMAFGVPQHEGLLEHLAALCTIRCIQQQEESKVFLYNNYLRERSKR